MKTSDASTAEEDFFGLDTLQIKVASLFTLLASGLMVLLGVSDYLLGLSIYLSLLKFAMAIPFLIGYFLIRKKEYYQLVIHFMLVVAVTGIFLNYLNNDGFRGPTFYTLFILVTTFAVLLRGWSKLLWFTATVLGFCVVFYLDVTGNIRVVNNYQDQVSLYWDHVITLIWCSLFIFTALYFFISSYQKQTLQMDRLSQKQRENLQEIERVNEEKNRLLALLSHDLKNPIGTLSTTLSLVDEGVFETKEIERIMSSLKNQTYHLNKVLNNTLSYVLTELGSESQVRETQSIVNFSKEISEMLQVQADQKKQTIDFTVKGPDQEHLLEINEISIILKNLLDNAIKFSDVGATIFFVVELSGSKVRWMVINEGVEIPRALHSELFQLRVKPSFGTEKERGTGLGLPLSKKIAEANGLLLGFESSSFKTVFFLEKQFD